MPKCKPANSNLEVSALGLGCMGMTAKRNEELGFSSFSMNRSIESFILRTFPASTRNHIILL